MKYGDKTLFAMVGTAGTSKVYYYTERTDGKWDDIPEPLTREYIWGLYDALLAEYPQNVTKNEYKSDDGTFTNYEYVISVGNRTRGVYTTKYGIDVHPKYLVMSGIHGTERKTVLSTYSFIADALEGRNIPHSFSANIHVLPIGTPSALEAFTRYNDNAVDVNRNFDCGCIAENVDTNGDKVTDFTYGESAASEKETQAIKKWMQANSDADLFVDFHNSSAVNEVVVVMSDSSNGASNRAKQIALQGVDRVIPYWKNVIGYQPVQCPDIYMQNYDTFRDIIYSYSAPITINGSAVYYAQKNHGIPSIGIETRNWNGSYREWEQNKKACPVEPIAAGAETLGNILIEFCEQADIEVQTGVSIYNGEAVLNIDTKTYAKYNGEVE